MTVNQDPLSALGSQPAGRSGGAPALPGAWRPAGEPGAAHADRVEISRLALALADAQAEMAAGESRRVSQLETQYREGRYQPDVAALAGRIVDAWLARAVESPS